MFDAFNSAPMIGSIAGMGQQPAPAMQFNPLMFTPAAPSTQYNDFLSQPTFEIRGLYLQETGTYNDQFHRPYVATMDNNSVRMMQQRVEEATSINPAAAIEPSLVAGLCSGIITPSASHEGTVNIVNGWNQKRFRFILVVEVPNAFMNDIYIFQGYSEFFDRTAISGLIDPNMVFFINSEIRIQRRNSQNNFGFSDRIAENRQFIDGRILANNQTTEVSMLRPKDVISGIQTNHINNNVNAHVLMDSRVNATNEVVSNSRKNGIPSRYLARTISGHRSAQSIAGYEYGDGNTNVFDRTIQALHESSPNENPFIQRLTDMTGFTAYTKNNFTLTELEKLDPFIGGKINYSPVDERVGLHATGMTSYLNAANIETMLANMISNGLSALMIEAGLSFVSFMTTTMVTGQPNTTMISPGRPMTTQNPVQAYNFFINLFNTTLMPDLSRNFTIPFTATIVGDLFGDIDIVISIDGGPPERCVFPAFADSLITPVATRHRQNYLKMAAGVEDLINACGFDQVAMNNEIVSNFIETV